MRELGGGSVRRLAIPLCAGRAAPIHLPAVCSPSLKGFHPLWHDADGLSLWQHSAALLPAPRETLAGGRPPSVSDDMGPLQAGAEGSHTKYARCHLRRTQTCREQTAQPTEQPHVVPRENVPREELGRKAPNSLLPIINPPG